jgi:HD-GYP domain-containing protein (c-di-GMP phosphodiesterase class II)
MTRDVKPLLEREIQLNLIAYLTILSLVAVCGILTFMLVANVPVPSMWILRDDWIRWLSVALVLGIVVYLAEMQRRLQLRLRRSYAELGEARAEIASAYERLAFAHHAAEVLTALPQGEGLSELLDEVAEHFGADAAAVVGQDVTMYVREERDREPATEAVMHAAVETVSAGKPLALTTAEDGSTALAVPLRVEGRLNSVLCIWRNGSDLQPQNLEALQLVARILELHIENCTLIEESGGQVGGMIRAVLELLELRRPAYRAHADIVARVADGIGRQLKLDPERRHSLRLAALMHDIGLLEVPEGLISSTRELTAVERGSIDHHPEYGARLAEVAGLSYEVQSAIRYHHERLDGSGYPKGISERHIPLLARILAVADDYASMTSPKPDHVRVSESQAAGIVRMGAGSQYDQRVIDAFTAIQSTLADRGLAEQFAPESLLVRA